MRQLTPREKELERVLWGVFANSTALQSLIYNTFPKQEQKPSADAVQRPVAERGSGNAPRQMTDETKVYSPEDRAKMQQMQARIRQLEELITRLKEFKDRCEEIEPQYEQVRLSVDRLKQDNDMLREERDKYREAFEKAMFDNEVISRLIQDERDKNSALKAQMASSSAGVDNEKINTVFQMPITYLELHKGLPREIKSELDRYICDLNEILFVVSGASKDSLKGFWNCIANNLQSSVTGVLGEIFDYIFYVYNSSLSEPEFIRDNVEVGDIFDVHYHESSNGLSSGTVSEVLLRGYRAKRDGRAICPSIVAVE